MVEINASYPVAMVDTKSNLLAAVQRAGRRLHLLRTAYRYAGPLSTTRKASSSAQITLAAKPLHPGPLSQIQ